MDGEDDESAIEADENDEDDEEDEEDDSSSDEDDDLDESDAEAPVDPAFRQRVAEALQVSGMAVDTAAKDGDSDAEDDDEDSENDDEAWDDDAMMKVDEQLAEVFRQRANAGKKTDFKREYESSSISWERKILRLYYRPPCRVCSFQISDPRLLRRVRQEAVHQSSHPTQHRATAQIRPNDFGHRD